MKYLNQLEYPNLPYPTDLSQPDSPMHGYSVKEAGCGLCCLAMMVDRLTTKTVSLKRLISLSKKHKANLLPGTDMKILGPATAKSFDLDYSTTDSVRTAISHLQAGGSVIANVGGDRDGYTGVFSHGGHYILLLSAMDDQVCLLDPSLKPGKYEEAMRDRTVLISAPFIYCSSKLLEKETDNRKPCFYLFSRKKPQ